MVSDQNALGPDGWPNRLAKVGAADRDPNISFGLLVPNRRRDNRALLA